jgi:hypothetical protein
MPSATRPSGYPHWGVSATNITTPPSTYTTSGWTINEKPPSSYENWLRQLTGNWLQYLDQRAGAGLFGDGSDGDHILDGVTSAPSWAIKAGSVYTLHRDVFANSITVTGTTCRIFTGPWRLFVSSTLTTPGYGKHIFADGGPGVGTSGGFVCGMGGQYSFSGVTPTGTVKTGGEGGRGGISSVGTAGVHTFNAYGGSGGTGGTETLGANAAGMGGRASGINNFQGTPRAYSPAMVGLLAGGGTVIGIQGGGGGGGGSSEGGNAGGGGAGGGVLVVCARTLNIATGTDLSARGGTGANGAGGAGGGGGGGGGVVIAVYENIPTGVGFTGSFSTAGGAPGTGGGGYTGQNGRVFAIQI